MNDEPVEEISLNQPEILSVEKIRLLNAINTAAEPLVEVPDRLFLLRGEDIDPHYYMLTDHEGTPALVAYAYRQNAQEVAKKLSYRKLFVEFFTRAQALELVRGHAAVKMLGGEKKPDGFVFKDDPELWLYASAGDI